MRYLLFLIMFLAEASHLRAESIFEEKVLEPAILEAVYERIKVTDTLNAANDFRHDLLTLRAGQNMSAFYCAELKTNDSICERSWEFDRAQMRDQQAFAHFAALEKEIVFKNYPTIGQCTSHLRYAICDWVVTEDWEKPQWTIVSDSMKNICGYDCIMATSQYRGRTWIAWFTPEIPIQEGPWKLCGLPGLILKAYDSKMHYSYTAQTIKTGENVGNVEYWNYRDRFKTDRIRSLKQRRKELGKSIKNEILASGFFGLDPKKFKRDVGRPPHTIYDFEETDYPHE